MHAVAEANGLLLCFVATAVNVVNVALSMSSCRAAYIMLFTYANIVLFLIIHVSRAAFAVYMH